MFVSTLLYSIIILLLKILLVSNHFVHMLTLPTRKKESSRPNRTRAYSLRYTTYSVRRLSPFIPSFCNGKAPARSTGSAFDLQLKSDFPSIRYSHPASTVPDSLCLLLMCTLFLNVFLCCEFNYLIVYGRFFELSREFSYFPYYFHSSNSTPL